VLRKVEEEAGYIRFEVERKLNRCLKLHGGIGSDSATGNVVGGNFYSARAFGKVRGEDFEHTGYVNTVHADNIRQTLDNNDVVLLTTVGNSPTGGDSVNVNGHHLAANVASALGAYKLIYMANEGSVLSQKGQESKKFFQEVPLSFAKDLADFHQVKVHKTGFATFEQARQNLEPRAVELLLNLAWGSWALENGVKRAHIVNPKDGALLEELFTSKNGANTCLYHDDENDMDNDDDWLDDESEDWNEFFAAAASQR
jgi:amino-acid N-acetyltransferase